MGVTNHGTQTITFNYYMEAKGENFSKLFKDAVQNGIYTGGYLSRVSDAEITFSTSNFVIGDGTHLVSVSSAANASITTAKLDSGALTSATPWIVLRWNFSGNVDNYVEIHALSAKSSALTNDLIVGRVLWTGSTIVGFDYTSRSEPKVLSKWLSVEATTAIEMYVQVRGGQFNTGTATIVVPNQKVGPFTAPSSPNSRIDLVYVDTDGTLNILQGTAAVSPVAPTYENKMVLAEVTVVNGATNITQANINDTRAFLISPSIVLAANNQYFIGSNLTQQLVSSSAWATVSLTTKKISGITSPSANVFQLESGKKYRMSYICNFGSSQSSFVGYASARIRVLSGDTSWYLDSTESNVSTGTAINFGDGTCISGEAIIHPNQTTTVSLEALTSASGMTGYINSCSFTIQSY